MIANSITDVDTANNPLDPVDAELQTLLDNFWDDMDVDATDTLDEIIAQLLP